MKTMFVGGFGAVGHSYWMGQQIAPLVPTPQQQPVEVRAEAPAPTQAPAPAPSGGGRPGPAVVPVAVPVAPYTIPIINQQVPGTVIGIPTKTLVVGGAIILGVVVLSHVL